MEALTINTNIQNRIKTSESELPRQDKTRASSGSAKEPEFSDVSDSPDNRKAIESAIKALEIFQPNRPNTRFQYQVHADSGHIQVALVNFITGEVVQEVPSSKLLDYASRMEELSGLVLEKKA